MTAIPSWAAEQYADVYGIAEDSGKMQILTLNEVNELKTSAEKQFGIKIHFHDSCGGQSFSVDTITPDIQKFIRNFFDNKGMKVAFSDDMCAFFVKETE